jgi:hypothetical protein
MDNNFSFRATMKSDEELHKCIDNREKYLPESVEAAVIELQNRGVDFSDEELKVIAEDMQARRDIAESGTESFGLFNRKDKNYHVEDPDAPAYYSKFAIVLFSVLFSVLFGSIMLAVNVSKTQNITKAILVILYGLGFTAIIIILAQNLNISNTYLSVIAGMIGAYSMEILFWKRYLGNATLYRVKPIWIPLIIGLAIVIPIIILIINNGTV